MKISTLINYAGGFNKAVAEIKSLEKAGLDVAWVPEAYSFDAPSAMGYLAAETERVIIASGILPIYTRTPSLLAMTAGVDYSDGRAMLGLGASGPQVIEGFHGLPYTAPVAAPARLLNLPASLAAGKYSARRSLSIPTSRQGTGLGKPPTTNHLVRDDIQSPSPPWDRPASPRPQSLQTRGCRRFIPPKRLTLFGAMPCAKATASVPATARHWIFMPGAVWRSAKAQSRCEIVLDPVPLFTLAAWARALRTSTTIFSLKADTPRKPESFKTYTWLAKRKPPKRPFPMTIWPKAL